MTGSTDGENRECADPVEELLAKHGDALEEIADSDSQAAWVAEAFLEAGANGGSR